MNKLEQLWEDIFEIIPWAKEVPNRTLPDFMRRASEELFLKKEMDSERATRIREAILKLNETGVVDK